jgi:hypothetical protein
MAGYFKIGDRVHKNPPQGGCNASPKNGTSVSGPSAGSEKCDKCFGLPR